MRVRDGNTHYPAEKREWRFFNGALDVPPAIIAVDGSGEITMDAIDWLATQRVPLIRLRWDGQFASVVTTGGQAASSDKVYWQERTRNDPAARLRFARDLIRDKALSTLATMKDHVPRSAVWDNAYENIAARSRLLEKRSPRSVEELLGIEGSIANEYFRAWSAIELKWKALKQRPVPDDWWTYKSRSALRDESRGNHSATHPVNAMLNYAYGVLIARTHVQLIAEGYDPTIGILHGRESELGRYPAFALDRMEPMRPVVDRAVLRLVNTTTFAGGDFSIQPDGACRLNPELARRVAQLAVESGFKNWAALRASATNVKRTSAPVVEDKPTFLSAVPVLFVRDVRKAAAFYADKLAFQIDFLHGNPPFYGSVSRDHSCLHLRFVHEPNFAAFAARDGSLILASIQVRNVKMLFEEYERCGVEFSQRLVRQAWGGIDFHVRDVDGNVISFVQYRSPESSAD